MALQQVQLQAAAASSGLQEALQRLHRLRQQLRDSSSVVENTNNTVRETNQLVTRTQAAGQSPTLIKIDRIKTTDVFTSCFLCAQPMRCSISWRRRSVVQSA